MIRRQPTFALLFAALLYCTAGWADDTRIELIELKGRPAAELIPLLQPLVAPDGAITGTGYRLIVRGTAEQQRAIRQLLDQLDQAPKRLLITVQMGQLSQAEQQQAQLDVRARTDGASVALGLAPEDSATVRLRSTRSVSDAVDRHQVQTLEGEPTFIVTGSEHPYPTRVETWQGPRGVTGGALDLAYKQAKSGFYALANVRGNDVVIRISPQRERFDEQGGGTIDSQHVETTVSGPLGGWIRIGAAGTATTGRQTGIGLSASTTEVDARPVWIKVELEP